MRQEVKYSKINSRQKQIPNKEHSTTLLSLCSLDLKYMFPWSQYDNISDVMQNCRPKKTEKEKSILVRELKISK